MSASRRWLRLDIGWDDTEWLAPLSAGARLSWIQLLCHAKRDGIGGRCRAVADSVAARRWGVVASEVREMIDAGRQDGAIFEADGEWVVTAWNRYQVDGTNAARQAAHRARKSGA